MERRLSLGVTLIAIGVSQVLFFATGIVPAETDYFATWILAGVNGGVFTGVGAELLRNNLRYEVESGLPSALHVALAINVLGLVVSLTT